ncbi:hypothetical protein BYT27DRAFT_7249759 [Phlegmacium glaucopus]|nr:hypothetical protein BYT27DRAFT_7249759 [Phlegmacium glaucopus]
MPTAAARTSGNILPADSSIIPTTVFIDDSDKDMSHIPPPLTVSINNNSENDATGPPDDVFFDLESPVDSLADMVSGEIFIPSDEDDDDAQDMISEDIFVPLDDDQDGDDTMFQNFSETFIPESDGEEGAAAYGLTGSSHLGPYTAAHFANFDDNWLGE